MVENRERAVQGPIFHDHTISSHGNSIGRCKDVAKSIFSVTAGHNQSLCNDEYVDEYAGGSKYVIKGTKQMQRGEWLLLLLNISKYI